MLVLYLSPNYILGMIAWLLAMSGCLWALLWWRRSGRGRKTWRFLAHAALSVWMFAAMVTVLELVFALAVDHSDAFNITNVSKRWLTRHIDAERNAAGFRDALEFNKRISDGSRRIVFVGDSFTVGHGIRDMRDRFTDRIASRLEQAHPGRYVVANLGEPGYETSLIEGLVQAVLSEGYDVDMFVYVYNVNDIEGYDPRTEEAIGAVTRAAPESFLFRDTYFLNWLYFRLLQYRQEGVHDYFPHLVDSYRTEPWQGLRAKLIELSNDCRQHGVEFRMVIFPFLQSLGPDYEFLEAHAQLVAFCKEEGVPVLDLEPVFLEHRGENLTVNRFDAHPNERAHEIAADAIQTGLLQDLFAADASKP